VDDAPDRSRSRRRPGGDRFRHGCRWSMTVMHVVRPRGPVVVGQLPPDRARSRVVPVKLAMAQCDATEVSRALADGAVPIGSSRTRLFRGPTRARAWSPGP
jgi:hypothetical protein